MFRKTVRKMALLGVLLVVALFLALGSATVSRGATQSSAVQGGQAPTSQVGTNLLGAPQLLPNQTPPPGHHCHHRHHCPQGAPTPAPHGTPPRDV